MNIKRETNRFRNDWEIDYSTLTIHRKPLSIWKRLKSLVWKDTYPLIALYRFAKQTECTEQGIRYAEIIKSDGMKPTTNIPTRFELCDGWTIPESDLKFLKLGPLTKNGMLLVPALPQKNWVLSILSKGVKFTISNFVKSILATLAALLVGHIIYLLTK